MSERDSMGNFLIGAAIGAGLALLLAPATGGDTRRHLRGAARKLRDDASGALENVKGMVADGTNAVHAAVDSGKETFRRGNEAPTKLGDRG